MNGTLQPDAKTYIAQLREVCKAGKLDLILNFCVATSIMNKPNLSKSTTASLDARLAG